MTGRKMRIHTEIIESALGAWAFEGMLEDFLEPAFLPGPLRRLHDWVAIAKIETTTLRDGDLPSTPLVWVLFFPRSRGQDLRKDFSPIGGRRAFPVVAYGYRGTVIDLPLTMDRIYDIGLGIVERTELRRLPSARRAGAGPRGPA